MIPLVRKGPLSLEVVNLRDTIENRSFAIVIFRAKQQSTQTVGNAFLITANRITEAYSLERPVHANRRGTDAIPTGSYNLAWTKSPSFGRYTWEVLGVPGRAGIRIHPAGDVSDLEGCIAFSTKIAPGVKITKLQTSTATIKKWEEITTTGGVAGKSRFTRPRLYIFDSYSAGEMERFWHLYDEIWLEKNDPASVDVDWGLAALAPNDKMDGRLTAFNERLSISPIINNNNTSTHVEQNSKQLEPSSSPPIPEVTGELAGAGQRSALLSVRTFGRGRRGLAIQSR